MQPLFEKIPLTQLSSYQIREFKLPQFDMPLHFHPELELTWIVAGKGKRIVGDSIADYGEGDLVLIGSGLSHFWYSDKEYAKQKPSHSVVIHFKEGFLGEQFFKVPEMINIHRLLEKADRGISIGHGLRNMVTQRMQDLLVLEGSEKIFGLLAILNILAQSDNHTLLSSLGFNPYVNSLDCERINKVSHYVLENFASEASLAEAASIIHMKAPAFCFYFKKRTCKNFSQFVNEIRIGHVCKLLMETEMPISEICFASGFNNLSNFNRRFRELHQVSPSVYRKKVNLS